MPAGQERSTSYTPGSCQRHASIWRRLDTHPQIAHQCKPRTTCTHHITHSKCICIMPHKRRSRNREYFIDTTKTKKKHLLIQLTTGDFRELFNTAKHQQRTRSETTKRLGVPPPKIRQQREKTKPLTHTWTRSKKRCITKRTNATAQLHTYTTLRRLNSRSIQLLGYMLPSPRIVQSFCYYINCLNYKIHETNTRANIQPMPQ